MKTENYANDMIDAEKERLKLLADQLDELQKKFIKNHGLEGDSIAYVDWIVQDLRRGDLAAAKNNYAQQSDKYDSKREIRQFLEDNGIAEKGIDWRSWQKFQPEE